MYIGICVQSNMCFKFSPTLQASVDGFLGKVLSLRLVFLLFLLLLFLLLLLVLLLLLLLLLILLVLRTQNYRYKLQQQTYGYTTTDDEDPLACGSVFMCVQIHVFFCLRYLRARTPEKAFHWRLEGNTNKKTLIDVQKHD